MTERTGHARIEQRESGDYMAVISCRCGASSVRIRPTPGEAAHALIDSGNSMEPALCDDCAERYSDDWWAALVERAGGMGERNA